MTPFRSAPRRWLAAALLGLVCAQAVATDRDPTLDYPSHAVKIIVPTPPGGTNDIIARAIAQQLTQRLGQAFIVENRPGANANIGAEAVVRAKPDGYTLLCTWAGPLALNQLFGEHLNYNAATDLTPVTLLADVTTVLVANPSLPVNNLREFVTYVQAHPKTVAMAISTIGSMPHLLTEQLRASNHLDVTFVPYQGSGPAINDLLGNTTQAHFENLPAVISLIKSGKLKALAVASRDRSPLLPDVPTTAESGYPAIVATPWFALAAPSQVPPAIVQKLNAATVAALRSPEVRTTLEKAGAHVLGTTPSEAATFIEHERVNWKRVVVVADISIH